LSLLKTLILPPANLIFLALLALWLRPRKARGRGFVLSACLVALYICSTPMFSSLALSSLQPMPSDPVALGDAQAIVLLGGGTAGHAPEYGRDSVNHLTLARTRYAATLQRATGKPLLVSGGSGGKTISEAAQMRAVLTEELGVPVQWLEDRSTDTYTNALESAKILLPQGVTRIYLVTHAWHMPRALLAFRHAGFEAIPAPTGFASFDWSDIALNDVLPRASALVTSYYFFHEVLGYAVYAFRIRS
jgi:uncharacterized SAM-binding protein YcdF (DUF218 family)